MHQSFWNIPHMEKILIDRDTINTRIQQLSDQISVDFLKILQNKHGKLSSWFYVNKQRKEFKELDQIQHNYFSNPITKRISQMGSTLLPFGTIKERNRTTPLSIKVTWLLVL